MRLRSLLASTSVLAITVTAALAVGSPAQATADDPTVAKSLAAEVQRGEKVRAIIEIERGQSLASVARTVEAASSKTKVISKTSSDGFIVATVDKPTLAELKTDSRVKAVYKDEVSKPTLDVSTKLIGSDRANQAGWTGKGSTIAILDTGIDRDHPFFAGRIVGEACFSSSDFDPYYLAVLVCPDGHPSQIGMGAADAEIERCVVRGANKCYHGSHVAGIAAGKKAGTAPSNGVAPEAGILPIQVSSRFNGPICEEQNTSAPCILSFTSDQKRALQYVDEVRAGLNVVAVSMSIGGGPRYRVHCDGAPLESEILQLKSSGVATVISSGNDGSEDGVVRPGCIAAAVTVGATDDHDTPAPFGNRGPLIDLFAPGVAINSAMPGNTFGVLSGTSMAAPHVAGALALLRQAYPHLPGEKLVEKLQTTGKSITYRSGDTTVTTKRIDLLAALPPMPTASPTPTVTPTATPTATPTRSQTSGPADLRTVPDPLPVPVPDTCERGEGAKPLNAKRWATEMLRGKGTLDDRTLVCYLSLAQNGSKVFPEVTDAGSLGKAYKVLAPKSRTAKALLDRELLAAWLNYAHGVHNGSTKVHGSTTLTKAVGIAEEYRTANGTSAQLKKAAGYLYKHVNK
ncbi:S8 family peptidase [Streptosporangium minutum]|uniref:S8 family peptidase n=1 Tax=Streptosporangium minutum TaxID=569862 RepID=UPI0013FDC859|nr:S8 family serine peptidase [Streptosporangium minutum]